jgi:hypothetical protein
MESVSAALLAAVQGSMGWAVHAKGPPTIRLYRLPRVADDWYKIALR